MAQLFLLRDGRRTKAPTAMDAFAKGLGDADLQSLAAVFEKQKPPAAPAQGLDKARFERGRVLAAQRNCGVCHNRDFSGRDQMARLANQREDYLRKALRDYRDGNRIGYGSAAMPETVEGLPDADLDALAHFLAYQPARRR